MHDTNFILTMEKRILQAWRALEMHEYDGWRIHYSQGYTNRANSVSPLGESTYETSEKITYCEAFYQQRGLPSVFKMTPIAQPPNLDTLLAENGYTHYSPTSVQTASLENLVLQNNPAVQLTDVLQDQWLDADIRLNEIDPRHRATIQAMLLGTSHHFYYASVHHQGEIVASGLGVQDADWIGLFSIVTHPDHRGKGLGNAIVKQLLYTAQQQGAKAAYLQVKADNYVAHKLYHRLGFEERYTYWYRRKDV